MIPLPSKHFGMYGGTTPSREDIAAAAASLEFQDMKPFYPVLSKNLANKYNSKNRISSHLLQSPSPQQLQSLSHVNPIVSQSTSSSSSNTNNIKGIVPDHDPLDLLKKQKKAGPVQACDLVQTQYKHLWGLSDETEWNDQIMQLRLQEQDDSFDVVTFIRDLFYHVISSGGGVIAYPFCALMESHFAAVNRGFWLSKDVPFVVFWIQSVFGLFHVVMHILYFWKFYSKAMADTSSVYTIQLLTVDVFLFLRAAVIAGKYANLSQFELKMFRTKSARSRLLSLLLIPAWKKMDKQTLELETVLAALRGQIELPNIYFTGETMDGIAEKKSAVELVNDVIKQADAELDWLRSHNISGSALLAIIQFAIPGVVQAITNRSPSKFSMDWSPESCIYLICHLLCTLFFFATNLQFMFVGSIDYARRAKCLQIWGRFITSSPCAQKQPFIIDFTQPSNITSWILCRTLLKNHGTRFLARVQINTMIYVVFLAAIVIYLLVPLILTKQLALAAVAIVSFDCFIFVVLLTMMAIPGGRVNEQQGKDAMAIQRHLVALKDAIASDEHHHMQHHECTTMYSTKLSCGYVRTCSKAVVIKECISLFEGVKQHLQLEDQFNPLQLLGLRASPAITNTILSLLASGLAAVYSLISTWGVSLV